MISLNSHSGNSNLKVEVDEFGNIRMQRQTYVCPTFIDACRQQYEASKGETQDIGTLLFSIPAEIYYDWLAEGFDPVEAGPAETKKRLLMEGLDHLQVNANI